MSMWTHVIGTIYYDTMTNRKNIKKYVENMLETAPKITGSEQDCDILVKALSGYNTTVWDKGESEHYQTCVCITLAGDLRDRTREHTDEEIREFLTWLKLQPGFINDYVIKLRDDTTDMDYVYKEQY